MDRTDILLERVRCRLARILRIDSRRNLGPVELPFDLSSHPAYAFARHDSYDIPLMVLMREKLGPGGVFIDVGANIGYVAAVGLHRVGPGGTVIACEPVADHAAALGDLAARNPGRGLRVVRTALGAAPGRAMMAKSSTNHGWNTLVPEFMAETHTTEEVDVVTLDALVASVGVTRVDLVKIDVEGYELPVLEGMRLVIDRFRPLLHVECAPQAYPRLGRSIGDLEKFLDAGGYMSRCAQTLRPLAPSEISGTTNLILHPREVHL